MVYNNVSSFNVCKQNMETSKNLPMFTCLAGQSKLSVWYYGLWKRLFRRNLDILPNCLEEGFLPHSVSWAYFIDKTYINPNHPKSSMFLFHISLAYLTSHSNNFSDNSTNEGGPLEEWNAARVFCLRIL